MTTMTPDGRRCKPIAKPEALAPYCYYDPVDRMLYFRLRWRGKNVWQAIKLVEFVEELNKSCDLVRDSV